MRALTRAFLPARILVALVAAAVALSVMTTPAHAASTTPAARAGSSQAEAEVGTAGSTAADRAKAKRAAGRGAKVIRVARSKAGAPYSYGAAGPRAFDCSGYTMWVYRHVGERLPHSSAAQVGRTRRIAARAARPGDLVFFTDGGGVYHVAIYAGHHSVWHAPRTGERVHKERIWTSSVFYGRVR